MSLRAAAVVAMLLLSGCGHFVNVQSSLNAYRDAPSVASLADLPSEALAYPTEVTFSIDEHSPVFEFPETGKSFIKIFALPATTTDYRLVVRSYILRDGLFGGALFYPLVTFLDAGKTPIATSSRQSLQMVAGSFFNEPDEPNRLQFAALMTPQNPARYIVIHTSRTLIEFGMRDAEPARVQLAATTYVPMYIPMDTTPRHMPGSPVGYLKITLGPPRT